MSFRLINAVYIAASHYVLQDNGSESSAAAWDTRNPPVRLVMSIHDELV
jgi:hypothetical protein